MSAPLAAWPWQLAGAEPAVATDELTLQGSQLALTDHADARKQQIEERATGARERGAGAR
jgi:hypothetical protein